MKVLPTACSMLVTEQCNLRCTYCFEHHKNKYMTEITAKRAIDWLYENAVKSNVPSVDVTMFGGEPMLNWRTIEKAFERGFSNYEKTGIVFNASIITNATIMSDDIFNMLKKWKDKINLNVQLSIDGKPEIQNEYRITRLGHPSWDMVKKNIPKWKELFKDTPNNLSVHGCLNHKTVGKLYSNYKFFHDDLGFTKIWYIPVAEEKWEVKDVDIYKDQTEKIYENVLSIIKNDMKKIKEKNKQVEYILKDFKFKNDYINQINSLNNIAIKELYNYAPLDRCMSCGQPMNSKACGAGVNYVTITADGEVYPCHQIYFNDPNKETKLGDIYDGIDNMKRKIFLEYDAKEDFIGCEGCDHNNCYRCLASNYVHKGNMFSQIKDKYCEMMKIDKLYQEKLKGELVAMGLLNANNNNNNQGCSCHNPDGSNGCDIVNGIDTKKECNCNDDKCDCTIKNKEDGMETIAAVLNYVIDKLDNLEKKMDK